MEWDRPSERVAELLRRGAEIALNIPPEWLDELDHATLAGEHVRAVAEDPVLNAATRRTNRANLRYWAEANVRDPGAPVPANLGPEPLAVARDLVRRGLDESALHSYRAGQNVAWRLWMKIAFELTRDPDELQELLDVSARSISDFIDVTITGISARMQLERDQLTRGTQAERREVVALILDGAPITRERAATRLGYELAQPHTAAVIWSEDPNCDLGTLELVAETVAHAAGSPRPLTVVANAATLWVWAGGAEGPDLCLVEQAIKPTADVRVAVGPTARGVEGFRRSHQDAITTQRMLARMHSDQQLASYDDVQLVALLTEDQQRATEFMLKTLGEFETASAELRDAVRVYIHEQSNASRAAKRLYTHRNSLLRRLTRAEQLLPRPLSENSVDIAVALEMLRWRGTSS